MWEILAFFFHNWEVGGFRCHYFMFFFLTCLSKIRWSIKSLWNLVVSFLPIIRLVKYIVYCMKLLYAQKIHFLAHFFSEDISKKWNLLFWIIWACLATHIKKDSINFKKLLMLICRQKINFILYAFFEILQTYHFRNFGYDWLRTPKVILSTCKKLSCLSTGKRSTLSMFFWRYSKDIQTSYFG